MLCNKGIPNLYLDQPVKKWWCQPGRRCLIPHWPSCSQRVRTMFQSVPIEHVTWDAFSILQRVHEPCYRDMCKFLTFLHHQNHNYINENFHKNLIHKPSVNLVPAWHPLPELLIRHPLILAKWSKLVWRSGTSRLSGRTQHKLVAFTWLNERVPVK